MVNLWELPINKIIITKKCKSCSYLLGHTKTDGVACGLSLAPPWARVEFGPVGPSRGVAECVSTNPRGSLAELVSGSPSLLPRGTELIHLTQVLTVIPSFFLHQLQLLQFNLEFENSDQH